MVLQGTYAELSSSHCQTVFLSYFDLISYNLLCFCACVNAYVALQLEISMCTSLKANPTKKRD